MTGPTSIIAGPTIILSHQRIHEGRFSSISFVRENLSAIPKYILIISTARPFPPVGERVIGHVIFIVTTNPGVRFEIFEDAMTSANGTEIPVIPHDRNRVGPTAGFVFEDPTVVSEGTKIWDELIGTSISGEIGGPRDRDEDEIMLKLGSKYLLKTTPFVNNTTITIYGAVYTSRQTVPTLS